MGRQPALGGWGTLSGALKRPGGDTSQAPPGQADKDLQLDSAQREARRNEGPDS